MKNSLENSFNFSDYLVFVDESGDHGLLSIDANFPVFVLVFCIIKKQTYIEKICPDFYTFKHKYWGHENVILHEADIRKKKDHFQFLRASKAIREAFFDDLNSLIHNADFKYIAAIIDKKILKEKYTKPFNPYEISTLFCLERLTGFLSNKHQGTKILNVVIESRGKREDSELRNEFFKIIQDDHKLKNRAINFHDFEWKPIFVRKQFNTIGLQIADLIARPIALNRLRTHQQNRAFDIIIDKCVSKKVFP